MTVALDNVDVTSSGQVVLQMQHVFLFALSSFCVDPLYVTYFVTMRNLFSNTPSIFRSQPVVVSGRAAKKFRRKVSPKSGQAQNLFLH
jgi:hypothetical protein